MKKINDFILQLTLISTLFSYSFILKAENKNFLNKIGAYKYYEPAHSKVIKFITAPFPGILDLPAIIITSIKGSKKHKTPIPIYHCIAGKYKVIVNNYTEYTFKIEFGEGGENDGDFDLVHGQHKSIPPITKNIKFDTQWKVAYYAKNDSATAQINILKESGDWNGWKNFGNLRISKVKIPKQKKIDGLVYYLSIASNSNTHTYVYKADDYIVSIFFPTQSTIQINFDYSLNGNIPKTK